MAAAISVTTTCFIWKVKVKYLFLSEQLAFNAVTDKISVKNIILI